ncbi:reverse transcriptase [Gossypium australe]|uniref:Reverse transcriptase n=1 Tax=Gossypium australe TaxID=47621 RepID=A0A5B6VZC6_9ROSI|nr:reverse transcriptase [Gossypium australe]
MCAVSYLFCGGLWAYGAKLRAPIGEGLSSLLRITTKDDLVTGTKASRVGPMVSHLLSTDDSLVFGEAKIADVENLQGILRKYEVYLGQLINLDKSLIYFSLNVDEAT